MSVQHPIIAVTGSSGAGTTTVMKSFAHIFRREGLKAQVIEGDSFHRYNRVEMRERVRVADSDLLFYEGLHGGYKEAGTDVAQHVDLLVGVVPIINLEWIQKLHRDQHMRGYSQDAVVETILRRMPDYVNYICPQFSRTHVNFQRVPTVDTSNPFVAMDVPSADESLVVIRFANPKGIDFPYLISVLHNSWMSRPNNIVVPGGQMGLAMKFIFTPMILRLMDLKRRAR